mgnify:CR=1 FL=1
MRLVTSFTGSRGVRYPSPDVARGFMLLLIALANIPSWVATTSSYSAPVDTIDTAWLWARTLLVDHRAYPLFALLFGFGLATMINRRIASGTQSYLQSLPGVEVGREPTPQEEAWAREQATVDARRLVRRRGWWMLLFGFVHGIFFVGDIIGVYGLVAVVFAGWLARKRYIALCIGGVVIAAVAVCAYMAIDLFPPEMAAHMSGEQVSSTPTALPWFVVNISGWIFALFAQFLITLIVPAAVIGARLADTDIIIHPERHRGLLMAMGIGGLTLGTGGALHSALTKVMSIPAWPWDFVTKELFGLGGACGWLALLVLYAGGPREGGGLTGLRRLASAVGRRSMTAYLSQTILFGFIFVIVPLLVTGERLWLGQAGAALVAVMAWLVTVVLCVVLDRGGHAGPFETLLRTAVARSERKRPRPVPSSSAGAVAVPADARPGAVLGG